jgi:hypothetical protein
MHATLTATNKKTMASRPPSGRRNAPTTEYQGAHRPRENLDLGLLFPCCRLQAYPVTRHQSVRELSPGLPPRSQSNPQSARGLIPASAGRASSQSRRKEGTASPAPLHTRGCASVSRMMRLLLHPRSRAIRPVRRRRDEPSRQTWGHLRLVPNPTGCALIVINRSGTFLFVQGECALRNEKLDPRRSKSKPQ